eukprot:Seg251.2 transcript_id=Seg251.2/GoldUCD/mRNA.D3Y31 product="Myeloid leukemia factor 1" protein_id=Seg251.2/GoldUCD/D3Y31
MALGDIIRGIFSKSMPQGLDRNEENGVTGLPRNIEEDLLQQRQENAENIGSTQNWHREWNDSVPNFQIFVGPESEDVADDDFFNMSHSLFHQMDEMMRAMLQGFGNFNIDDSIPGLQQFEGQGEQYDGQKNEQKSPRDKMLKNPYGDGFHTIESFPIQPHDKDEIDRPPNTMLDWSWTFPFGNQHEKPSINERKDRDFDDDIHSGKSKLDDILEKQSSSEVPRQPQSGGFSFGKFSSIVTKKRADGVIESHKTVRDSDGSEEVTVIRKIGDQAHKKTTIKDTTGAEEVHEDLMNLDEGELNKFEDAWSKSKTKGENIPSALWKRDGDRDRDSFFQRGLYDSIKDLFLPWKRDE